MVNLGDYVGKLLSEVTKARVQADIEAVRIAELYASDPLLKNFPVPRVRLPKVDIEAPVIITDVDDESSSSRRINAETLEPIYREAVLGSLKARNIKLDQRDQLVLDRRMKATLIKIDKEPEQGVSNRAITKKVTEETVTGLKSLARLKRTVNEDQFKEISLDIQKVIDKELVKIPTVSSDRIKISPLTASVKAIGDKEKVTTIKMSIVEEGVEWVSIGEDGTEEKTLVME